MAKDMTEKYLVTIDGKSAQADAEETILSVAERLGISIPTLCYLRGYRKLESCGICAVELEGESSLVASCAARVRPDMVAHTDTEAVRNARRVALELLLSDHVGDCVAPCELACPASIDIPGFLREIKQDRFDGALRIMKESVAFPGVLGRICPKFCELVCRRGQLDEPVSICALKRNPADKDAEIETPYLPEKKPDSGKTVAIVGAGIAGLTTAWYLLQLGHKCAIFEASSRPGGAIREIVSDFRLPQPVIENEIEPIVKLGAEIEYNRSLGEDFSLEQLQKDYSAVLLTMGARKVVPEPSATEHVTSCLQLLTDVSAGKRERYEGDVVVVGSGPVAIDACRTLLRLGATKCTLLIESPLTGSLFFKPQIQDAQAEGVEILDRSESISVEKNSAGGFVCKAQRQDGEITLQADFVFAAEGIENDLEFLQSLGLETSSYGVKVDRTTSMSNLPGVFAAGNVVRAGRYAVHASSSAKQAAISIDRYLSGQSLDDKKPINVRMGKLSDAEKVVFAEGFPSASRTPTDRKPPEEAIRNLAEVNHGFSEEKAKQEASRCLNCDCAAKDNCGLRDLSTEYGAKVSAYSGDKPPFERDTSHPEIDYEPGKCIKCGRCIAIAEEQREPLGLNYIGRGFRVRIGVPLNGKIAEGLRKAALKCADCCPTGALSRKRKK